MKGQSAASAFSKADILASEAFRSRRDVLSVLLEDGKQYTLAEVDGCIKKFMKGGKK